MTKIELPLELVLTIALFALYPPLTFLYPALGFPYSVFYILNVLSVGTLSAYLIRKPSIQVHQT